MRHVETFALPATFESVLCVGDDADGDDDVGVALLLPVRRKTPNLRHLLRKKLPHEIKMSL